MDPQTGVTECFAATERIRSFPIAGLGEVCFLVLPGCPAGFMDCDGGTPMDQEIHTNHTIGACGLTIIDPNGNEVAIDPNDPAERALGNSQCEALCDNYCATELTGDGWARSLARCEGFCAGGPREDQPCTADSFCTDNLCTGDASVSHRNHCNCHCRRTTGTDSRPGAVLSRTKTALIIEMEAPCDGQDITSQSTPRCGPSTTEMASTTFLNVLAIEGKSLDIPPAIGEPGDCDQTFVSDPTGSARLIGHTNFTDSGITSDNTSETRAFTHSRENDPNFQE